MNDEITTTPKDFFDNALKVLNTKTPADKIKSRPGAGGRSFSYVELGYVVTQLDKAFNRLWEFEILEQEIGKGQVWVKGRLTVHLSNTFSLKKESFGSAEIKRYATTKAIIDIGNDLKTAQADALKKAASLLGVAQDIYFANEFEEEE